MRIIDGSKIPLVSFIYCLIIILYAGLATRFTRDLGSIDTVGNAVGMAITVFVYFQRKIVLDKKFLVVLIVFFTYGLLTTFNQGRFSFKWLTRWPMFFMIAYLLCHDLKDKLFVTIETVICLLCVISLIFWTIQTISPSTIFSIVKQFQFDVPFSEEAKIEGNMLVFTLNDIYNNKSFLGLFPRNAGFAWEPGAFGSYICLGLFSNMLRKGLSFTNNIPFFIMVITLLTTQSTTAIVAYGVSIAIWLAFSKNKLYALWVIPFLVWIYALPFISEKAMMHYNDALGFSYSQIDFNHDLNRMQSFIISWNEFLEHPILGLGGDVGGSIFRQRGFNIAIFSGIGELLYRYGLIMSIVFFTVLYKSCIRINENYRSKAAFAFIGMFVCIMVGFNNWDQPIFVVFWLYCQFCYSPRYFLITKKCSSERLNIWSKQHQIG